MDLENTGKAENPPSGFLDAATDPLTSRQRQVYELHRRGLSSRTIALVLNIHRSTVLSHLQAARYNLANPRAEKMSS